MEYIFAEHELVLSSYVVEELKSVVRRKFPKKRSWHWKTFILMSFEYVYTPDEIDQELFEIRDVKDYPVLLQLLLKMWMFLLQVIRIFLIL